MQSNQHYGFFELQHLALLVKDADAALLVNLINSEAPLDIYSYVVSKVRELIARDDDEMARWWEARFAKVGTLE
jgi:DNA-directed RNA polymerase